MVQNDVNSQCKVLEVGTVVHAVGERTLQNALRLRVQWTELEKLEQEARAHTPQATRTPSHADPTRDEPGHSTRKKEQVPKLTSLGHKSTGPSHVSPRALCPWAGTTQHSRPSPSLLRCDRYAVRLLCIECDVEQRQTALRRADLKDSCLFAVRHRGADGARKKVHGACMVRRA